MGSLVLLFLAAFFGLVSLACVLFVWTHAFQRSLGTGIMVLLIPCYVLVYAFSQFEHPRKSLLLAGFVSATVLAAVFFGMGTHALATAQAASPP